jgi:hypothetical protein
MGKALFFTEWQRENASSFLIDNTDSDLESAKHDAEQYKYNAEQYKKYFHIVVGQRDSLQRELNDVGDQRLYYYNELQKQKEEYERLSEEYKYMRQNASWWRSGDNHILNKYNDE